MQKASTQPSKTIKHSTLSQAASQQPADGIDESDGVLSPGEEAYLAASLHSDLAEHLDKFDSLPTMLPPTMLNHNLPWRTTIDSAEPEVDNFIRDSDPQKQRFDKQVNGALRYYV